MRPIEFRGKCIDTGEWVYGFYGKKPREKGHTDEHFEHFIIKASEKEDTTNGTLIWFDDYVVNPDTIGQFTGLHDKNGKEVYEGDIIRCKSLIASIVFGSSEACFYIKIINSYDGYIGNSFLSESEVIGNINDNPELLEGK